MPVGHAAFGLALGHMKQDVGDDLLFR